MAELVSKNGTGFSITCIELDSTAPDYVILSMSVIQSGRTLFESDISEWRSVSLRDLDRFVNGIIVTAMQCRPFFFVPQVTEFKYRHSPNGRVTFSLDVDRDNNFKLSGNFLMIDFQCDWADIMMFAEHLKEEIDELEQFKRP